MGTAKDRAFRGWIPGATKQTRSILNILKKLGMSGSSTSVRKRRNQFDSILNKYGHIVVLQRRCTVSEGIGPYEKHPDSCTGCLGHGYSQTGERHLARKDVVMGEMSIPQSLVKGPMGIVAMESTYFYMKYDVEPKEGDRVFEWMVEEDKYRIFKINKAVDMRAENGATIYWVLACNLEDN
jgi:hypothetical protein